LAGEEIGLIVPDSGLLITWCPQFLNNVKKTDLSLILHNKFQNLEDNDAGDLSLGSSRGYARTAADKSSNSKITNIESLPAGHRIRIVPHPNTTIHLGVSQSHREFLFESNALHGDSNQFNSEM